MSVLVPPLALAIGIFLAWGGWIGLTEVALLIGMYLATGLGITIGFHRLFTHGSFHAVRPLALGLGILGSMAVQGPLIWWVATHRRHHQHSDEELDPHSPHAGRKPGVVGWIRAFAHAHTGWLFAKPEAIEAERYAPDLLRDSAIRRINSLFPLWVIVGLAIPALIGGLVSQSWAGAGLGLLWGGIIRIGMVHHITWSVNSVCHIWGSKEFESDDESRNNAIMGILAFGEGWHNNHHAFPASPRHGLGRFQFDLSWVIIRSLAAIGLVSKLRLPPASRMNAKRRSVRRAEAASART